MNKKYKLGIEFRKKRIIYFLILLTLTYRIINIMDVKAYIFNEEFSINSINDSINYDVDVIKSISEIKRGGIYIYQEEIGGEIPYIQPNDEVIFRIEITNKSTQSKNGKVKPVRLSGIVINNILSIDGNKYEKKDWIFTMDKINPFDISSYRFAKEETISVYTIWKVTIEEANYYNNELEKDIVSKVSVTLPNNMIKETEINPKIDVPILKVKKIVVDKALNINNALAEGNKFIVKILASNGEEYAIQVEAGEEYILNNLKYGNDTEGIIYSIKDIVPMNYSVHSIEVSGQASERVMFTGGNNSIEVIIQNKKENDRYFYDIDNVENRFGICGN